MRVLPWSGHEMSDFFECVRLKWRSAEQRAQSNLRKHERYTFVPMLG